MEFSAIFHDTTKKYAYALEKGLFVIRLKAKKNDVKHVRLLYQDKYVPIKFFDTRATKDMYKIASDNYCDYFEVQIDMDTICLRYQFELEDYEGNVFYYANHEFYKGPRTHIDYMYDLPQNLREEEMVETPEWAKNKWYIRFFHLDSRQVNRFQWKNGIRHRLIIKQI